MRRPVLSRDRWRLTIAACLVLLAGPALAERSDTERAGDIGLILLPVIAYGGAALAGDDKGRAQFHRSFLVNGGLTFGLKALVDKQRPDGSDGDSFPSAHTSISFHSAAFIQRRYGWKLAAPAWAAAAFVGYSRVEADKHHVEDVMAGAAIGALGAWLMTDRYGQATVRPVAGRDYIGIQVRASW